MSALTRPLVLAHLAFLFGLLPGLRYAPPVPPLLVAAGCCFVVTFISLRRVSARNRGVASFIGVLAALACTGAVFGSGASSAAAADCRRHLPDGAAMVARGHLAGSSFPLRVDSLAPGPLLPLEAAAIGGGGDPDLRCAGEIRVRLPERAPAMLAGTELRLSGRWVRYSPPVVPSSWPRDARYYGFLVADSVEVIAPPDLSRHTLLAMRGRVEAHLNRLFPHHGALADALLLGRREHVDPELRDRYTSAGLAHLLAISGMHVGLLAAMLLLVGSSVPVSRRHVAWAVIACVALYLAMIGAPASAVRAGVMVSLALIGVALQRPFAALPVMAAAAFFILIDRPLAVLEPGFQLSFAGVVGILAFRDVVLRQLPHHWRARKPVRAVWEAVVISGAAFVATAPITAWHFGTIAPVALVANLPAVPLMSLAVAGIVLAALVEPVLSPLGFLFADGAGLALDVLDRIAGIAAGIPFGNSGVARPEVGLLAVGAVVLVLALDAAGRFRPRVRWATAGLVTAGVMLALPAATTVRDAPLEIHFIDVGQGDAVAIRTPRRRWLLIDAGPRYEDYDAGRQRVLPFLRAQGVRRLEAVVLTHPDADHVGGMPAVLRGMPVGRLVDPGFITGSWYYLETLRAAQERDVPWNQARSGAILSLDSVFVDLLWPDGETLDHAEDANEISVVVRLRYRDFSVLLMGDAPGQVEQHLVRRHGPALRAGILKVAHHGSYASTTDSLLAAVDPQLVVISVGRRNRHGHPAPEVLRRLEQRGIAVARTDREGTVSIRVDPENAARWRRIRPWH